jgi:hypothetical protein
MIKRSGVEVIELATNTVVTFVDCYAKNEQYCACIERGIVINLDREKFVTRVVIEEGT